MHRCDICGNNELALSEINLRCGYGSIYDGETLTLSVCGDCMDRIYNTIRGGIFYQRSDNA